MYRFVCQCLIAIFLASGSAPESPAVSLVFANDATPERVPTGSATTGTSAPTVHDPRHRVLRRRSRVSYNLQVPGQGHGRPCPAVPDRARPGFGFLGSALELQLHVSPAPAGCLHATAQLRRGVGLILRLRRPKRRLALPRVAALGAAGLFRRRAKLADGRPQSIRRCSSPP